MKFSLIATIVLLALAQGSFAEDSTDLERISQYLEEMKAKLIQDMTEIIHNQDLATRAQVFLEERKTQLEPLAAHIPEQMKTVASNVEEQIRPLTDNVRTLLQPQIEGFNKLWEAILEKLKEPVIAVGN